MVKLNGNTVDRVPEPPTVDELAGYVTMAKARELSGYTNSYLLSLVRQELLRGVKLDKRTILIERASLESFLAQRREKRR